MAESRVEMAGNSPQAASPGGGNAARKDNPPPQLALDEKASLLGFLGYLRESVIRKVEGLSDAQARQSMVPSGTSLLGILKHLVNVELAWVARNFAGEEMEPPARGMALAPEDSTASVVAAYRQAAERCDAIALACNDLDQRAARASISGDRPTLRWILLHLVEETARHAGHADILREQIDGQVGR